MIFFIIWFFFLSNFSCAVFISNKSLENDTKLDFAADKNFKNDTELNFNQKKTPSFLTAVLQLENCDFSTN
jgi:hypothetical protein